MGVGMCLYDELVQTKKSSANVQLCYNVVVRSDLVLLRVLTACIHISLRILANVKAHRLTH